MKKLIFIFAWTIAQALIPVAHAIDCDVETQTFHDPDGDWTYYRTVCVINGEFVYSRWHIMPE